MPELLLLRLSLNRDHLRRLLIHFRDGTQALYSACGAAPIYLGKGLLHFEERARVGTIGYLSFGVVNTTVSMVRPGYAEMMRKMQIAQPKLFPAGAAIRVVGPICFFALLAAAFCAVPIFFL